MNLPVAGLVQGCLKPGMASGDVQALGAWCMAARVQPTAKDLAGRAISIREAEMRNLALSFPWCTSFLLT